MLPTRLEIRTYVGDLFPYLQTEPSQKNIWIAWDKVIDPPNGESPPILMAHTWIEKDKLLDNDYFDGSISDMVREAHKRIVKLVIEYLYEKLLSC